MTAKQLADFSGLFRRGEQVFVGFRDGHSFGILKGFNEHEFYLAQYNKPKTYAYPWEHFEIIAHAGYKFRMAGFQPDVSKLEAVRIYWLNSKEVENYDEELAAEQKEALGAYVNAKMPVIQDEEDAAVLRKHLSGKHRHLFDRLTVGVAAERSCSCCDNPTCFSVRLLSPLYGITPISVCHEDKFVNVFLSEKIYYRWRMDSTLCSTAYDAKGRGVKTHSQWRESNGSTHLFSTELDERVKKEPRRTYYGIEVTSEEQVREIVADSNSADRFVMDYSSGDPWEFSGEMVGDRVFRGSEGYVWLNRKSDVRVIL